MDCVAHDGERPPIGGTHLACEDRAPVHPNPDGQRGTGVHDLAHGEEHSVFVVSRCCRRPGDKDDLSPIPVGICCEKCDLLPLDRMLRDGDEGIKPVGRPLWPLPCDQFVGAIEMDESDGHSTGL